MTREKKNKKGVIFIDKDILQNALVIHSVKGVDRPRRFMLGSVYKLKKYLKKKVDNSV